ncbi:MAG: ATP-binding cassette domain-containing protein [Armatimonadetes bacterium]|nr:ATP-binding cassette domain-containing protein [Armatimonadota bacterium]
MISLEQLTIEFGARVLFDELTLLIRPHDRLGLVGSNGAGKSTLLKVIGGTITPDRGKVSTAKYVTAGYLPQDGITAQGRSLYAEAESAFEEVMDLQQKKAEAEALLHTLPPDSEDCLETVEILGELQHRLEDLDADRMQSKIGRVLTGLGFSVADFDRQTEEFSGGWQMRIALAKLLLQEPSVLLLDEPTNHLDIESQQWLEEYLRQYDGAVILVSHDRAFLDALCTRTLALSLGRGEEYAGNYSFYENEKELRKELQLNAWKNQQEQIKQTQQFITRFRAKATKARQVQSRVKQLGKIERIEIGQEEDQIHFRFPPPPTSGKVVMELHNLQKSYGDNRVFDGLEYTIHRGDRIAVVGVNGAGKSTFSRLVAGVEHFDAGERSVGHNTVLSYFAQHQAEELDRSKTALEVLDEVAEGEIRKRLRTVLGSFLFSGDDVFKGISVLSGGEKSRVALAKMLLQPSNFLIMDEPTNHLDMQSKQVLQEALQHFTGTYLIVSHDRAFLDPLVNKVLEVRHGGVVTYLGNVSDYLDRKRAEREDTPRLSPLSRAAKATASSRQMEPLAASSEKERKRLEAELRQERHRRLQPLKKQLQALEKSINSMESRKTEIEALMADPEFYKEGDAVKRISVEYQELQQGLEKEYAEWTEVSQGIAAVESG